MSSARVVVVGGGLAGVCAALAAAEHGANVTLIDAAPEAERGGNSRLSGGNLRTSYDRWSDLAELADDSGPVPDVAASLPPERLYAEMQEAFGHASDAALLWRLAHESFETVRWLARHGVVWRLRTDPGTGGPAKAPLQARGGGEGMMAALYTALTARGDVESLNGVVAERLLEAGDGVGGVLARDAGGRRMRLDGAVVLASGGYAASRALRVRYFGDAWADVRVRGTSHVDGAMAFEALRLGAAPAGSWGSRHASHVAAETPAYGRAGDGYRFGRNSYPYGITVNRVGERFFDEGSAHYSANYYRLGEHLLRQPGGQAFQLFDQAGATRLQPRYADGKHVEAGNWLGLARALDIDAHALHRTVRAFNRAADRGVGAAHPDGGDLVVPKSSEARPLDAPPYLAFPVVCGLTMTFAGLAVDPRGRVRGRAEATVPGLWAAGEAVGGVFVDGYVTGVALAAAAVLGRAAGADAALGRPNATCAGSTAEAARGVEREGGLRATRGADVGGGPTPPDRS